ncbi:gliding motility-associated ABC transporter ATP-binding subunit GldA [Brumimicrobium salinarum]|uniref:Gliding motility-associated ABC transporter ATP-binding subunit GldA n=1 Tax=Brumimicrobium salinarum TaxID=2058658 RepID=A0A2I0QZ21_9FLAO|nr:gliding motility-associated ABC transporter ATP-binding subunit GldA [Brumimicrobium salinarum]PKR79576.1 gliding motility-associated ABC transporter ATP-binding subunit GldA [Brumimicrobium salinarum]
MSISVKHLTKFYGEQAAVDNISFEAKNGEILGFLGPNGAGKSTTMKMITSFIPPSMGTIEVCGMNIKDKAIEIRKKIGYLPENNPIYLDMYVKEYLSFVGKIYKIPNPKERVKEVIHLVGLQKEQHKMVGQLSKGYRQRVGLAQSIIHDPEVLILDEPTSGLDPNQLTEIRELIKKIGQEKTVMLSTHIMQEVEAICDRVIIINNGKLVANAKASELQSDINSQVVFVEFDAEVSRNRLAKVKDIAQVESISNTTFLVKSNAKIDLRKTIAAYAQEENLLILTIRKEEKTLEEVFKEYTR